MHLKRSTLIVLITLCVAAGWALGSFAAGRVEPRPSGFAQLAPPPLPVLPVQMPPPVSGTFARVAETIKPAVINITSLSRSTAPGRTPFEEFFGEEFFRRFFGEAPERIPQRSLGSGVIVDPTGIALTNAHVVERATDIEVVTLDGSKHRAKVIGLDRKTDLAVLRLDDGKGSFRPARLGDSDRIQVGDWVLAIGSPFGLQQTVTAGIISAKARQIGQGPFDDFLQTDAAINPGNSGGPLVNMQAEVIGINTAIVASGQGIGFAIPSNLARKIYVELQTKGKVTRGWLGVSIQPLTPELARSFGAKEPRGVLISDVIPDSPAAKAGLRPGDILLEFEGKKMDGPQDLQRAVGLTSPGTSASIKVWREQAERTVELRVAEAPDEAGGRPGGRGAPVPLLGMEVRPITPEIARQLNLRTSEGVIVARVEDGGPAAEAGIQRGDVIRQINNQRVRALADYERAVRNLKEGDRLTVLLQRGPMSLWVAFTVGRG
jgi:serine protease Do